MNITELVQSYEDLFTSQAQFELIVTANSSFSKCKAIPWRTQKN